MKQPYRWRCFACEASNEATATSCSTCSFPARASGAHITRARAARESELPIAAARNVDFNSGSLVELLTHLTGWRAVLASAGAVSLVLGGLGLKFWFSWQGLGASVLAIALGLALFAVAHSGLESSSKA
jgi:hypothetical protein